jgi:hypothetical protein
VIESAFCWRQKFAIGSLLVFFGGCALISSFAQNVVSIYDEQGEQTNTVDFEAEGSTLHLADVKASIGETYTNGFGGVWQCELLYGSKEIVLGYDLEHWPTKRLVFDALSYSIGIGPSDGLVTPISGSHSFVSIAEGTMILRVSDIQSGVPNERLTGFGLTILSSSDVYYQVGYITAEAEFSDGTTNTASRWIHEDVGLGDTFFGFKAPPGASITGLKFSNTNSHYIPFDDLVIFTSVPEPRISSVRVTNDNAMIEFHGFGGQQYVIEYSPTLNPGGWTPVPGGNISGADQNVTVVDTNAVSWSGSRFYRLKWVRE